jgi:E3 ubiquitin-protein ligase BRE1
MLEADVSKKDAEIGKLSSDRYQLLESRKEWEEGILVCFAIAWVTLCLTPW